MDYYYHSKLHEEEEEEDEPVSPTGQYFNSSVLSISILGILDSELPINDSPAMALLQDVFLPINPRFSSLMVEDKNGVKHWKKVEVNLKDHINVPVFPPEKSPEFYDKCLEDYLAKISNEQFPQNRPLWEIHIIKYPTTNAAGNVVFKLHHALGDGFSLMGALLSCLQRADDPSLPLTFPTFQMTPKLGSANEGLCGKLPQFLCNVVNTISDFGWSLLKSSVVEDDRSPIRSGDEGVEFRPVTITTITFNLDDIKQIKASLKVTLNDVITGIIFLGTRLYMQETNPGKCSTSKSKSTALVLLNTRNIDGYKSVEEMVKPNTDHTLWGNQFAFLHASIPQVGDGSSSDPIQFIHKAQQVIQRKRNSAAVYLTGALLETLRKYRGPEVAAKYIHGTLKNSSMTISNLIGPVEQMALANYPIKGVYFMVVGSPESLTITMVSYMGKLKIAVGMEKGFMDPQRFKSCIEKAFDTVFRAAVKDDDA